MKKKIFLILFFTILYILLISITILLYPKKTDYKYKPETVNIILKGEVNFPGTYTIKKGTNLSTLIRFANGFTPYADTTIDQSKVFEKNEVITIPKIFDTSKINKFDLNKISFKELVKLDYITEKRAENIILYRKNNKKFKNLEELINVEGIGVKTFEKIKDYFFVDE